MDILGIGKAVLGAVDTVADKFFVDAKDKEAFKLKALELAQNGEFKSQEIQLSAILAEAKSADPWTSRASASIAGCLPSDTGLPPSCSGGAQYSNAGW